LWALWPAGQILEAQFLCRCCFTASRQAVDETIAGGHRFLVLLDGIAQGRQRLFAPLQLPVEIGQLDQQFRRGIGLDLPLLEDGDGGVVIALAAGEGTRCDVARGILRRPGNQGVTFYRRTDRHHRSSGAGDQQGQEDRRQGDGCDLMFRGFFAGRQSFSARRR